jgi:hypothetical protein
MKKKVVYDGMIAFASKYNLLTEVQNGSRKNKSTETASQTFIEKVQEAMDKRLYVIGIFFDVTKAYDMIDHNILLEKLNHYGITNVWFNFYLANRVQTVKISHLEKNNTQSKYTSLPRETTHGLSQGSISGPLLFLLYINDLPSNVQGTEIVLFADDINVLVIDNDKEVVQQWINRMLKQHET